MSGKIKILTINGPQLYRPYPGSPLNETAVEQGYLIPATMSGWIEELSSAKFGDMLKPEDLPWVKDPQELETILDYLKLFVGTRVIRTDLSPLNIFLRKVVNKIVTARLRRVRNPQPGFAGLT